MDTLKKIAYNININLENYYNKDDSNAIFVHKSGDTMTGSLILTGASYFQLTNEVSVNEIRTDIGLSSTDNQLPTAKAVYLLTSGITSGSTDLSNYYTKNESNTNFLSGNTSYYTQAEVNYLFTVSGGTSGSTDLSNYYNKTESDANFLSANTSYYTQIEVDTNFLSANTSDNFVSKDGDVMTGHLTVPTLSAQTIQNLGCINFNTGATGFSPKAGTVFFDEHENAISYKPKTVNNDVTINIGQESVIRVQNETGSLITNGSVCNIYETPEHEDGSACPVIRLANAITGTTSLVGGIATHDIEDGEHGFITVFGIVRDIDTNGLANDEKIYLSDSEAGKFCGLDDLVSKDSRTNYIGRILLTGATGMILVDINNENEISNISQRRSNDLSANNSSTGIIKFSGFSYNSDSTKYDLGEVRGWVVDNTTDPDNPRVTFVNVPTTTGVTPTYLNVSAVTFVGIDVNGSIIDSTQPFTNTQRRSIIELGVVVHSDFANVSYFNTQPSISVDGVSQFYDFMDVIGYFNVNGGNIFSEYSNNLKISKSEGYIFWHGSNYVNDVKNPHYKYMDELPGLTFRYVYTNGGTYPSSAHSGITNIDPDTYWNGSSYVSVDTYKFTVQRVYMFSDVSTSSYDSGIRIMHGQHVYDSMGDAEGAIVSETFQIETNLDNNALLRGFIIVREGTTDLSNENDTKFINADKFGHAEETSISDIHRNEIVNKKSTGLINGGDLSIINPTGGTFNISAGNGTIVDNSDPDNPTFTDVFWNSTGITSDYYTYTGETYTYITINNVGNFIQNRGSVDLTPQQKREEILLGGILHIGNQLAFAWERPIALISPMNQLEDLTTSIGPFSISGNRISEITGSLQLSKSLGKSFYLGGNYGTNKENPNTIETISLSASTLVYTDGQTILGPSGTSIDVDNYDPDGNGTLASITNNYFVAHRIWHQPTENVLVFQYGQYEYRNINRCRNNYGHEDFSTPNILPKEAYLVAVIIAQEGISDLDDSDESQIIPQGKFAGTGGGGGVTPDTFQSVYENSTDPELTTNSTRGSVNFRQGSGSDTDKVFVIENGSGVDAASILGSGHGQFATLSAQTFTGNLDWTYITNKPTTGEGIKIIEVDTSSYNLNETTEYTEIILHCTTGSTITIDTDQLSRESIISIKNVSTFDVSIQTEGSEQIDEEDTQTIRKPNAITIYSYDSNWWIK